MSSSTTFSRWVPCSTMARWRLVVGTLDVICWNVFVLCHFMQQRIWQWSAPFTMQQTLMHYRNPTMILFSFQIFSNTTIRNCPHHICEFPLRQISFSRLFRAYSVCWLIWTNIHNVSHRNSLLISTRVNYFFCCLFHFSKNDSSVQSIPFTVIVRHCAEISGQYIISPLSWRCIWRETVEYSTVSPANTAIATVCILHATCTVHLPTKSTSLSISHKQIT